jgi:hypothetical protein
MTDERDSNNDQGQTGVWGAMNEILAAAGLHRIKVQLQKRFLAQQCGSLSNCLDDALAATAAAAPVRDRPYIIDRSKPRKTPAHPEARWEEALFWAMKDSAPVSAPWRRLLTYQVNLPNKRKDKDWGEIDLLGVSEQGLPVLVELKAPRSSESPAQMLVQAAAYGVALRKAWPVSLRNEWERVVTLGKGVLPDELPVCQLVCAAPDEYWKDWTGQTPRAKTVRHEAWSSLHLLRKALESRGYPSVFVRLSHATTDERGLPSGITVTEERLPA